MVQPSYTARVYRPNPISIHLMLWFNFPPSARIPSSLIISIHLMLWFNLAICFYIVFIILFQYILCYGSTEEGKIPLNKCLKFQYILCYGSTTNDCKLQNPNEISIHLMLWFNINKPCAYCLFG